MNFVFLSYPYHYHITLVSMKSVADLYGPEITSMTVMFDDMDAVLNSRIDFMQHMQRDLARLNINADIIPYSCLPECKDIINGWERQQIIKLNLHKMLPYEDCFCVDGDTIFQEKIDTKKLYINVEDGMHEFPHMYAFANYVLDLNYRRYQHEGQELNTITGVPIRYVRTSMLSKLNEYIHKLHGCGVDGIMRSFTLKMNRSRYFELSEWDLMGYFEIFILGEHAPIENLRCAAIPNKEFETTACTDKIKILNGRDNLSANYYQSQGIEINHQVASALKYRKYLL